MQIHFTQEEMIHILQNMGYTVKEEMIECSQPVYHDDIEDWEEKTMTVYKDGEPFQKPTGLTTATR